ncbi:hypothetical protein NFI96_028738 [Prochilodus magdalenae]|nr:hypothetical protein NFI96_028738 [Prochilodus magdalenae]
MGLQSAFEDHKRLCCTNSQWEFIPPSGSQDREESGRLSYKRLQGCGLCYQFINKQYCAEVIAMYKGRIPQTMIRHLCSFLALCLHLAYGAVPGPCKYSVTEDHLLNLRRLVGNQLQNGCSISYNFTERQSLSDVCYIKAAFPHILDLLNTHFRYGSDSDNYKYTSSLKNLIYNIYSQKCIPPINEEIEDNPVKFAKLYMTSPREGLEKAEEVIQMYKNLVTKNDKPVRWNCEDEFAEDLPESSTTLLTQMSESKCQKNTEDTKTHISRDHIDRPSGKDFQLTDNSINATFIMTSMCISAVLLLTALLLLCKQERNIRLLFQRPREIAAPRSTMLYHDLDCGSR